MHGDRRPGGVMPERIGRQHLDLAIRDSGKHATSDRALLDPEDRTLRFCSCDRERTTAIGADDEDLDRLAVEHEQSWILLGVPGDYGPRIFTAA